MARNRMPLGIEEIYKIDYFEAVSYGFISAMICQGIGTMEAAEQLQKWLCVDQYQAPVKAINRAYFRKLDKHKRVMKHYRVDDDSQ